MRRLALSVCAAALAMAAGSAPVHSAEKPRVSACNGTLIIGAYPKQYWIIDEATEKKEAHRWVEEHLRMLLEGKVR